MRRPEKRADNNYDVAGIYRTMTAGDADKVKTGQRKNRSDPCGITRFSSKKNSEDRSQHHIESGYKTGVSGGSENNSELLKNDGGKKTASCRQRRQQQTPGCGGDTGMVQPVSSEKNKWEQRKAPKNKTNSVKSKRPNMFHSRTLCHKTKTPNSRSKH